MNRIAQFEKVSFKQFYEAIKEMISDANIKGNYTDEQVKENIKVLYDKITLPERATKDSAGYDIKSPIDFELPPHTSIKIPTGIRVKMEKGWVFKIYPRSGLGFKYRLQLDNTVGIIDGDYYYSDNEGHIFLKITNDCHENKTIKVDEWDRIAQGIFVPYGITYDDNANGIRNGGFGSTDIN